MTAPATAASRSILTQAAPLASPNEEARTVECTFTTGEHIRHVVFHRGDFRLMWTRLEVTDQACDLEFLRQSGPVLDSHMSWSSQDVIGSVEDAWIDNGVGRARLRIAQTADTEDRWQKISQGHLRNISAGFEVTRQEVVVEQVAGEDQEVMLFTGWRPIELSLVPVPADKGSFVQSAAQLISQNSEIPARAGNLATDAAEVSGANSIAATPAQHQETMMSDQPTQGATTPAPEAAAPAVQPTMQQAQPAAPVDPNVIRQAERQRVTEIAQIGTTMGLSADLVRQHQTADTSVDAFREIAIEVFAQRGNDATDGILSQNAQITADGRDRFIQGAIEGVSARAHLPGGQRNEFSGLSLAELARESLRQSGIRVPDTRMDMIGAAFTQSAGSHTTSDFANVLSALMNKGVLKGWEESEETFEAWTSKGTLPDFKASKRVGLNLLPALRHVPEGAEFKYVSVGDRGEDIALASYGEIMKVSRQAIINDDLSLFSTIPAKMGRAARRTIGDLVYAVLTSNPTMSDGTALFHADHANLAGSGAALSVTSLSAARAAMRTQKSEGKALNIRPANLIVPAALETAAQQLMTSIVDPTAQKGHATNPVAGMATVVTDPRLDDNSATAWYLAASPSQHDTIEVAYLDGIETPRLEQQTAWTSDGVEIKVAIDAGVAPLDYRTFYKNPGA